MRNKKAEAKAGEMQTLYLSGKSISDISEKLEIPKSTVRNTLVKYGVVLRSVKQGLNLAKHKLGVHALGKKRNFTDEHKRNMSKAKKFRHESVSFSSHGYLRISNGKNKGKQCHTLVMEEYLGRSLRKNEVVHHIDHDKTNNDIDNLCLLTKGGHSRLHRFEENIRK